MRSLLLAAAALALLAPAAHASGGGAGLSGDWGGRGATAPGRAFTYIALPAGAGSLVQAVHTRGGAVDRWKHFGRRWGVPQAAYDGATTGLSADGRVLVLTEIPRTSRPDRTRLLVLRATTFETLERFGFPGRLAVTAISPHGRYVYLNRYAADPGRFEPVVLDRGAPGAPERLGPRTAGLPTARVSDGRSAYTLYQGAASWVQAIDTVARTVRRFELPRLRGNDLVKLTLRGGVLRVGATAEIRVG